ncbi:sigma-54 interaction domain-containing protein [Haloimpatiens lingqiaonensis]|uniref:sigma-54 interaction domain-containing protein n=1 Tax=Haloimpatiens lingqiaonensis TaxID=1380675 RepID=UPI001FA9B770|nr:sigma 54-interacting transcriptional regulator [Haloimpatiens lingqiaonensis]
MIDESLFMFFEGIKHGIMVLDNDLDIVFINSSLEKNHNINRSCQSKNILQVYPNLIKNSTGIVKALKTKKPVLYKEEHYINYKGEEFINMNSSYPIFHNKKLQGIISIIYFNSQQGSLKCIKENNKKSMKKNEPYMYDFMDIVGVSKKLLEQKNKAYKAAQSSSPVLIYGETGVGKEMFVQAIHKESLRKCEPFIVENCAAIPESLFESTMFGTVKGSFTGAEEGKGILELAHKGTLYLDELNSMPKEFQGKLLRFLQEGVIRKVGGEEEISLDVRVIASLNEKPEKIIKEGKLREDLYYRLNVIRLNIPPLRERREDIKLLIYHFINKYNNIFNKNIIGIEEDSLNCMINLEWNGNIRELEHVIEEIFNYKDSGYINNKDLQKCSKNLNVPKTLKEKLELMEKEYIQSQLIVDDFNISKASRALGIPRQTLQYKIKKFKIEK